MDAVRLESSPCKKFITEADELCPPSDPIKLAKLDCSALAVVCAVALLVPVVIVDAPAVAVASVADAVLNC